MIEPRPPPALPIGMGRPPPPIMPALAATVLDVALPRDLLPPHGRSLPAADGNANR